MRLHLPASVSVIVAFFGVPILFGVFVLWTYRYSLPREALPMTVLPEWLWLLGFGLSLVIGIAAVLTLPLPLWLRILAALAYVPTMAFVLLIVQIQVACSMGDCSLL